MRRRARVDANHGEIKRALEQCGWKVRSLAQLGDGMPDLLACRGYDLKLIEVKRAKGTLTADQQRFILIDGWPVTIVRSVDDALNL